MRYIVTAPLTEYQYSKLLDFAFLYSQHFSVCTFNYHKKVLSETYLSFLQTLKDVQVDSNRFCLPRHYEKGQKFIVCSLNKDIQRFIYEIPSVFCWRPPYLPEDLTFYSHRKPWMISISHENFLFFDTDDKSVIQSVHSLGILIRPET